MSRATWAGTAYVAGIVAANYVTARYGFVAVGFGLTATAGTYLAGASFVLRDAVQDAVRASVVRQWIVHIERAVALRVMALIALGAAISAAFSPSLALASGVAFLLSESADLCVYTPLRRKGYVRAAAASNVVGTVVDTFAFLWLAGFPVVSSAPGQIVGKLWITLAVVLAVGGVRAVLRQSVDPEGA